MYIYRYILYNKRAECFIRCINKRHEAIAVCFIPDKTRIASLLYGFKNEPFRFDVKILKIDLV